MSPIPVFGVEAYVPSMCAKLSLVEIYHYDDPKHGVSFKYQGPGHIYADAYLYNLGLSNIPDDLKSPEVTGWFQDAIAGILKLKPVKFKMNQNPTEVGYSFLFRNEDNSSPLCLWAQFTYEETISNSEQQDSGIYQVEMTSHLTLRTDRGFINKIRFSYPNVKEISDIGSKVFQAFLSEWTAAVQNFNCKHNVLL